MEKFSSLLAFNTLRPRRNGRHFADDIFKCIFLNENVWIPFKISLKFVPKGAINNIPALVQIMAWRRSGDKPLSEPMMVGLPTHICVTRPQWVNARNLLVTKRPINPLWPSDTIWWHRSRSTLAQVSLLPDSNKPLPEQMMIHHQLSPVAIWYCCHQLLKISSKIDYLKLHSNLSGYNGWK